MLAEEDNEARKRFVGITDGSVKLSGIHLYFTFLYCFFSLLHSRLDLENNFLSLY